MYGRAHMYCDNTSYILSDMSHSCYFPYYNPWQTCKIEHSFYTVLSINRSINFYSPLIVLSICNFSFDHFWQQLIYNVHFYILITVIKSLDLEEKKQIKAINMLEDCLIYSLWINLSLRSSYKMPTGIEKFDLHCQKSQGQWRQP